MLALLAAPLAAIDLVLPSGLQASPGQQVEVTVNASNATGLTGFRVVIMYDPAVLSYVPTSASVAGSIAQDFLAPVSNTATPGRLVMSSAGIAPVTASAGKLLSFRLLLAESAPFGATIPLTFNPQLTRANDGALPVTLTNGSLVTKRATTLRLSTQAIPDPDTGDATVTISADSLIGISTLDLVVEIDAAEVALVAGSPAAVPPGFGAVTTTTVAPGRWRFQASAATAPTSSGGALLTFRLKLLQPPSQDREIPVRFVPASSALNGGLIELTFVDGSIRARRVVAVSLPDKVAEPGDVVELAFSLGEYAGLQGFRFVVDFPAAQAAYVTGSAEAEPFFREDFTVLAVNSTAGRLVISGAAQQPLAAGSGAFLRFRVRIADDAAYNTVVPFRFDSALSRLNDGSLAASFADGSIAIERIVQFSIPPRIPGVAGTDVLVPVFANNARGIAGFRISTFFPQEQAAYVDRSATNAGTLSERFIALVANAATPGRLVVSSSGESPLADGVGPILRFRLHIPSTAGTSGTIPLTLDPVLTRVNDGQFHVEVSSGGIELRPAGNSFPEGACLVAGPILIAWREGTALADVNSDMVVDAADLVHCSAGGLPVDLTEGMFLDTALPLGPCLQSLISIVADQPVAYPNDANFDQVIDAADLVACNP